MCAVPRSGIPCTRYATRVHPRIALLVQTISKAIDDLFHFLLLFVIILLTFCLIGVTTFGQKLEDYSSYGRCFGRLMDLMIDKPDFPADYMDHGPIFLVRGGAMPMRASHPVRSQWQPNLRDESTTASDEILCVSACLCCIGPSSYPLRFARSDVSSIALLRLCSLTQWLPWSGVPHEGTLLALRAQPRCRCASGFQFCGCHRYMSSSGSPSPRGTPSAELDPFAILLPLPSKRA